MLSRVAESIYWMSRHLERAGNIARFIDVNWYLSLDLPSDVADQWRPLIDVTSDTAAFQQRFADFSQENVIRFMTFDPDYPNSVIACARAARENARAVRDILSPELWEEINTFHHYLQGASRDVPRVLQDRHEFFHRIRIAGLLFGGIVNDTMMHTEAWHFFRMGRLIERADKTSRLVDVKYFMLLPTVEDVGTATDDAQWSSLLRSTSALEAYRKKYGRLEPDSVIDFLMLDPDFPRSVRYCLRCTEESIRAVSQSAPGTFSNEAEQRAGRISSDLAYISAGEIIVQGLHEYIDRLQVKLNKLDDAIYRSFLSAETAPAQTQTYTPAEG